MSNRKKYLNRLKEIFLDPKSLPSVSSEDDLLPEITEADRWFLSLDQSFLEQTPDRPKDEEISGEGDVPQPRRRIGWEDFLNAIDRSERLGYVFDQEEVIPLFTPLSSSEDWGLDGNQYGQEDGRILEVPLTVGETNVGRLQLETDEDKLWSIQEAAVAANVARQVAQHIENLRLLEQAEQYRAEAEQAVRRLTREGWENYLDTPAIPTTGYIYDKAQVKPMEVVPTEVAEPPMAFSETLKVREETIGELQVDQDNEEAIDMVKAVADRLSLHIESLRLLDETERSRQQLDKRAAELETVARVSTAAATILDPQTLLQSVVDLTASSFNLYHANIYLLEEGTNHLVLSASAGRTGQRVLQEGHRVDLNNPTSLVSRAAHAGEGIIVNDVNADPGYERHSMLPDTLSELAAPLIVGDQLLGVFDAHANIVNRFSEDDLRTYTTLASQVSVALRNAELYAEQMATVERLKELDHLKSAFLANMSHELRTPLNSILGFTQVLLEELDGPLTDNMNTDLELIEKNSQHLLNLINDVLDMAKIEAGRLSLSYEPLNLRELLEEILETTGSLARDRALYQKLEVGAKENYDIIGDRVRLRQILLNLIGNAIKFTDTGGVTVFAEKNDEEITIRISDTGVGIPPNKLVAIFEAFSQVDTSTTRKAGGTGLGLPISRRLVELHGGRLWAESKGIAGEGATFFLVLPVQMKAEQTSKD